MWKGKLGEKSNVLVLQVLVVLQIPHMLNQQLEKASKIISLDVCNAGSAFVEVLVGSSTWPASQKYEVIFSLPQLRNEFCRRSFQCVP
jgi:hypothetical protein